jgi:hypothetical protein
MPTISKANKVAALINVFTVEPGNQQKVVDMLVEATEKFDLGNESRIAAGILHVPNLNPHPSENRRVRHPQSRSLA